MSVRLSVRDVAKTFTMHLRDGLVLPVVHGVSFHDDDVRAQVADRIIDVTTFAARAAA